MPITNSKAESDGFTGEERAAMKARAAELRAEGKKGAKKADGLQAVRVRISTRTEGPLSQPSGYPPPPNMTVLGRGR
jgi:hypothetical protein